MFYKRYSFKYKIFGKIIESKLINLHVHAAAAAEKMRVMQHRSSRTALECKIDSNA